MINISLFIKHLLCALARQGNVGVQNKFTALFLLLRNSVRNQLIRESEFLTSINLKTCRRPFRLELNTERSGLDLHCRGGGETY